MWYDVTMSERSQALDNTPEYGLVPVDDSLVLRDFESFLEVEDEPNHSLRDRFEEKYAEELFHFRTVQLPCPDRNSDPEGYRQWIESRNYTHDLARVDKRRAIIAKRLATSIDEKIEANQPPVPFRLDRNGCEIGQYGNHWPRYEGDDDEEGFRELILDGEASEGITVPLNKFEVEKITRRLERLQQEIGQRIMFADIEYDGRDGGEVWVRNGETYESKIVAPDPEKQRLFAKEEARIRDQVAALDRVIAHYEALFDSSLSDIELRAIKRLPTPSNHATTEDA